MTTSTVTYKDDFVQRIGGSNCYEMVILEFCDRLKADKALERFYGNFDSTTLTSLLREALHLVFYQFSTVQARETAAMRVKLHHYRLVENGLSDRHFTLFCDHFVAALRESWVEESMIEIAMNHMKCLRSILFHGMDGYHQTEQVVVGMDGRIHHDPEDDSASCEADDDDDDEESVELAPVPTSPDPRHRKKMVQRRRSSKDKLASMFQSLTKNKARVTRTTTTTSR
jgi:truncated hemoglobin YjbI